MKRNLKKHSFGTISPAFTLVEVVVTLTILGFIVLMVFGVFRLGIAAWEKGETSRETYQKIRIASQLISRQVKSAVPYKVRSSKAEGDYLAFEGKAHSLKFISAFSLKARKPSGFVFATYEFEEDGKAAGRLLFREGRATERDFMEETPPEDARIPLFTGLSGVRFEYYREEDPENHRPGDWLEEWSAGEEKALPGAVRVTLFFGKERDENAEPGTVILASLPSTRHEEVPAAPVRRTAPPVSR